MKIINKINGVATNQDYNKGVQGLHNLGNTCFMNTSKFPKNKIMLILFSHIMFI